MQRLRWLALLVGFLASLAPIAQQLYSGWGPLIGAPTEIGGLILNLVLLATTRRSGRLALLFGLAVVAYSGMLLSFFLVNAPVNEAVNKWAPDTMPADWANYRLRWEIGHALAALFALLGLAAAGSATLIKQRARP